MNGLQMRMHNTDVVGIGRQRGSSQTSSWREYVNILLVKNFIFLSGSIAANGREEVGAGRRIQAGWIEIFLES